MNIALKSTNSDPARRYILVFKDDRSWNHQSDDTRFLCKGLGASNGEARMIGFWSFVDGFVAPESLAFNELSDCKFRRAGSFERVGRYLGAVMQQADHGNDERDHAGKK